MSSIYFHSRSGESALRGSERAYMGGMCFDLFTMALGLDSSYRAGEWLKPFLPTNFLVTEMDSPRFASTLKTWLKVDNRASLVSSGEHLDAFSLALNTAIVMGNEQIRLMARLHGQCELHCYVEGENRRWLAGIARRGRDARIFRPNQGWENVISFLESNSQEPVVCSYSVCERFPNSSFLPDNHPLRQEGIPTDQRDEYYDIPEEEAWDICMPMLRASGGGLAINEESLSELRFGHCKSAFCLLEEAATTQV